MHIPLLKCHRKIHNYNVVAFAAVAVILSMKTCSCIYSLNLVKAELNSNYLFNNTICGGYLTSGFQSIIAS